MFTFWRPSNIAGYHKRSIPKGVLGEISKIEEEIAELKDAREQGLKILELCELADLVGAIEHYLKAYHQEYTLQDLIAMSEATSRAFKEGLR